MKHGQGEQVESVLVIGAHARRARKVQHLDDLAAANDARGGLVKGVRNGVVMFAEAQACAGTAVSAEARALPRGTARAGTPAAGVRLRQVHPAASSAIHASPEWSLPWQVHARSSKTQVPVAIAHGSKLR